ncbi:ORF6N domain-containing protein [Mucilaginibacter conchicola]|uniref:ORF6N domain-containing protein n=1 Tax=Mucilaginibacter conchicola TaxID=2303333 RepID=A0A372NNC0_9SPHI|nr:ORF6N domain-containing protein [Mucilaginibacter conchicola]RFZ89875.1 ORF6N domain-containing protein [Mucilaginibacter conchicola]
MSDKNFNSIVPDEIVMNKIFYIRKQKVMLASDLAELYQIETRVLNQAVSRNSRRFPDDFMFQLTTEENDALTSQIVISKKGRGGRRVLPNVFTEHGVLMLSSVLNSDRAIQINIQIVRIFTKIRALLIDNADIRTEIEKVKSQLNNQSSNLEVVFRYLDELMEQKEKPRTRIGYKPEGFD